MINQFIERFNLLDEAEVSSHEWCDQFAFQVLDLAFIHYLGQMYSLIDAERTDFEIRSEEEEMLLAYLADHKDYMLFVSVISKWRQDRLADFTYIYPLVLGLLTEWNINVPCVI